MGTLAQAVRAPSHTNPGGTYHYFERVAMVQIELELQVCGSLAKAHASGPPSLARCQCMPAAGPAGGPD